MNSGKLNIKAEKSLHNELFPFYIIAFSGCCGVWVLRFTVEERIMVISF
jgi:hypothetical protein